MFPLTFKEKITKFIEYIILIFGSKKQRLKLEGKENEKNK